MKAVFWREHLRLDSLVFQPNSMLFSLFVSIVQAISYFGGTNPHFFQCTFKCLPGSQTKLQYLTLQKLLRGERISFMSSEDSLSILHFKGIRCLHFADLLCTCLLTDLVNARV